MSDRGRSVSLLRLSWTTLPLAVCFLTGLPAWGQATRPTGQRFVHPGLLHTRADLDRMKDMVARRTEPWRAGYEKPKAHPPVAGRLEAARPLRLGRARPA